MTSRSREDSDPVLAGDGRHRAVPTAIRGFGGLTVAVLVVQMIAGTAAPDPVVVDVLLVVAGFLTLRTMLRAETAGTWSVRGALTVGARTFLPTIVAVLATAGVASAVALPSSWWPQIQAEVVASVLLLQNWQAILLAPATAPGGVLAGPLAHLALVAIVGQLAVGAALVVGFAVVLARRSGRRVEALLVGLLLVAAAGSAAWALWSARTPALGDLDTAARAWAFAAGGLIAATTGIREPRSRTVATVTASVGLAGIAAAALLAVEPGRNVLVAVVATVGALAVLHACAEGPATPLSRTFASAPFRALGALALPLFLWSGVVRGFYLSWRDRPDLGVRGSLVVLTVTLALTLATRVVGRWSARGRAGVGVGGVGVGGVAALALLLATVAWWGVGTLWPGAFVRVADTAHPGAVARLPGYGPVPSASISPGPEVRGTDWAPGGGRCRTSHLDAALDVCGEPDGASRFTVVVVGDSHIEQLLPAIRPIVDERHGEVVTMLRGACPFSTTSDTVPGDAGCAAWNRAAMSEIHAMRPALVVTLASHDARSARTEETPPGFVNAWRDLDRSGIPVLAIRDNPRLPFSPTACVDARATDPGSCAAPRDPLIAKEQPWTRAEPLPVNVTFLDLSDAYCSEAICPAVVGNVLIYLDTNHVSATFGRTAAPFVAPALLHAVERASPGY